MTNAELKQQAIELVGEEELSRRFRLWITGLIKKERAKGANLSNDALFLNEAAQILEDLNKRTGRRYTLTSEAKKMIKVIMGAGYTAEDFYHVHEVMVKKWADDATMKDYLRPSTLWQLKKFDERLALWEPPRTFNTEGKQRKAEKSRESLTTENTKDTEEKERIAKLMAKRWWEFESWADFMKWTVQFPDAESLAKYEMPERIRKMRTAPGMVMKVLRGQSPDWAENEYLQHREKQRKD